MSTGFCVKKKVQQKGGKNSYARLVAAAPILEPTAYDHQLD
jgi:hypothetical protein